MSVEILPIGYYTVTVATPEVYTIEVVTPEVYTVTVAEPESYTITTAGTLGPPGPQGPAGDDGPNNITTSTTTNITGILKGDGTNVQEAVDGTDYNSQDLQSVLDKGNTSTTDIIIGDTSTAYSAVYNSAVGTENSVSGTFSYISNDGYLGLCSNEYGYASLLKTDDTTSEITLQFPDKPTGTYTIATTDDVPPVPALQDVTDEGNTTTNDIQLIDDAEVIFGAGGGVLLDNGSRLREGTIDAGYGGSKGISQICAVGYELKWEAGRLYIMNDGGGSIREVRYTFGYTPTVSDDISKGFGVGSRWVLDNGDVYVCTDGTTGAAVWGLNSAPTGFEQHFLLMGG